MRAAWKAREMGKDLTRAALCFCACNFLAAALAAQCPSPVTLILDQTLTSGNNNWRSNGSLKATNYTVSGSASVTFVAGQCIELAPNFHATAGTVTTFHAWVDALPTVSDASPKDGAGTSGQITWTASSPYGYGYLTTLVGDIGTSFTARDSCYVIFNASNVLQLADNSGTFPQANSMTLPSTGMIGNSQCTIYGAGSSVSRAGNQLALTVSVTFQPTYAGARNQYLLAFDQTGLTSYAPSVPVGTWTVPAAQQYSLTTSVSPSGSGTLTFSPPCCTYNAGTLVTITATAASGYQISNWTGVDSSDKNVGYVTMNSIKSVTASFVQTPVTVSMNPTLTTLTPSQALTFTATVTGTTNTAVTWSLTGSGSLSAGLYTAPTSIPAFQTATIKAKSVADPTKEASVTVTLAPTAAAAVHELQTCLISGGSVCPALPAGTYCISSDGTGTCGMQPGTYTPVTTLPWPDWDAAFLIRRSGVTMAGGGSDRSQTKLVRDRSFTKPIISVIAPNYTAPGTVLRDFTICGGLDKIRDVYAHNEVDLGTSALCPRQQTTAGFSSGSCGDMVRRLSVATELAPYHVDAQPGDFICTDIEVQQADTGDYAQFPFPSTSRYSLEIASIDLEDSAGNALSLYENGDPGNPKHINDVYIHNNTINGSAVTGILHGANNALYHAPVCDNNPNWLDDRYVFAPRNIRIETNTFINNNTGAMGSGAMRWVGMRNRNVFTNNYIHPQVGNTQGGVIGFDPCADQIEITGNEFTAPPAARYGAAGIEVYSRNVTINGGNSISGFPLDGITLGSVRTAVVDHNTLTNNGWGWDRVGSITVSTTQPILGPCGDSRDSRDVTINANTSTGGGAFGIYLSPHDPYSTATLRRDLNPYAVSLTGNSVSDFSQGPIAQNSVVVLDSLNCPGCASPISVASDSAPRALAVKAVAPVTSRCSSGTPLETFAFPGADPQGANNVWKIEVVAYPTASQTDPGGPGEGNCHFAIMPQLKISDTVTKPWVYLDAGSNGVVGSELGPEGHAIGGTADTSAYCTIHAELTPDSMQEPFISPFISPGLLKIAFPVSSSYLHIYTMVQNAQGSFSNGAQWTYWGWWRTQ